MKHQDLLFVRPGDGSLGPRVRLLIPVSAQDAFQVGRIGQEQAVEPVDEEEQTEEDDGPGQSETSGHSLLKEKALPSKELRVIFATIFRKGPFPNAACGREEV